MVKYPDASTSGGLSHAERLARLRDLRGAWNSLNWKRAYSMPMGGLCRAYELVEGVFVKSGMGDFTTSWLPSIADIAQVHQVHRDTMEIPVRDFAIDPGQDLIIFADDTSGYVRLADSRCM